MDNEEASIYCWDIFALRSGEVYGEAHCSQNTNWNIVRPLVTLVTDLLLPVCIHTAHWRRSPLSHVHQQLSPGAITARVHRVPVTRLPAQQWFIEVIVDFALASIFY